MIKYFNTLANERGDVLPNYRAQVVDGTGATVTIYRDKSGTRFTDASGNIVNYATASSNGRVSFYWTPAVGQTLQTLDVAGDLVDAEADFADSYVLGTLPGEIAQSAVTDLTTDLAAKADGAATTAALATKAATADLASTDAGKGAALVGFKQSGTGAVDRTAEAKAREIVSVDDFGAGNGGADDKAAIQLALDSAAKTITFTQGKTYVTDGGLNLSRSGVKIVATGATIKLKNSAATLGLLVINASDCEVVGGEWDGNKANGNTGTWGTAHFASYAVAMVGDRCTVRDARIKDFWGIGVKGFGNNLTAINNRITGTGTYGIFFDGSSSVSHSGNRAIGNEIDMSDAEIVGGVNQGQGILFTAGTGQAQTDYTLANNRITGPTTSVTDLAINLAVRGNSGVVSGNVTRYGGMGFSEGGDDCQITGNSFLQLRGTVRIGIEPSGRFNATGNTITESYVAIDATSTTGTFDGSVVSGNTLKAITGGSLSAGVRLLPDAANSAKNVAVTGNTIDTANCVVYAARDCTGLNVSGNVCTGPGLSGGTAIFLDGPEAAAHCSVTANTFNGFLTPHSVNSGTAKTVTDLFAASNNYINCGGSRTTWTAQGSATIGARVCVLGAEYGQQDVFDVARNVFNLRSDSFNNPEGLLTAGIGSIFTSLNSGGGIYFKSTGTGNTGWVAM